MILLLLFAFLAGLVTILSPCILPILPIVLSTGLTGQTKNHSRPLGVVAGFIASFTFFTLFLSTLVRWSGIPADSLRVISVIVIAGFGISLLVPRFQLLIEQLFSRLAQFMPQGNQGQSFWSGLLVGFSLGLLWTPCVGPILASVISLAITGAVSFDAFLITMAYSLGTAIPMFAIMIGGQKVLHKAPWLLTHTARIQKVFGVLMILTAIAIFTNVDRKFQTWVLQTFPQYGIGLTKIEDIEPVRQQLLQIGKGSSDGTELGKPMFDLTEGQGPPAPKIIAGGQWFNSEPLTLAQLKGKVVLIDFWTYSCINCQRTFPYLKQWWKKYEDDGLVIIGVHSPEFEFEKNENNVQQALNDFGLNYPVVQDNDFATWRAYENRYWPAKYLIDKDGEIRYSHFGEGDYDETEHMIQKLLAETGSSVSEKIENSDYQIYSRTPEIYLGYLRIDGFGSPEFIKKDSVSGYSFPSRFEENTFAFEGEWQVMPEYSAPAAGSKLMLNFEAKEVFLVARPKEGIARFKVFVDDKLQYFGDDNQDGMVTVGSDKLYKLINLPDPGRHLLRLEFEDDNIEVYAFTFG